MPNIVQNIIVVSVNYTHDNTNNFSDDEEDDDFDIEDCLFLTKLRQTMIVPIRTCGRRLKRSERNPFPVMRTNVCNYLIS